MEPRSASTIPTDPAASEFVRFCYRRRRVGWPELYDEMCAVAARGLFRGMSADDLGGLGIGFSLFDMPRLAVLANGIVAEEQAKRRPVAVAIRAEDPPVTFASGALAADDALEIDVLERRTDFGGSMLDRRPVADAAAEAAPAVPVTVSLAVVDAEVSGHAQEPVPAERQPERSFDVPIRLVRVPAAV